MKKTDHNIWDYSFRIVNRGSIWDKRYFNNERANNLYKIFLTKKQCPYCYNKTRKVLKIYRALDEFDEEARIIDCWGCSKCGWWFKKRINWELHGWSHEIREISVLREFDLSHIELPLISLNLELARKPQILYNVHHKKFEELVADVFKDFYDVDVSVIGKRGDGGIDLIYIHGNTPVAVQVKRRQQPGKVETVSPTREFLGALLLKGVNRGKIVTTADRFSAGAYDTTEKAIEKNLIQEFDLIDIKKFYEMFKYNRRHKAKYPWELILDDFVREWNEIEDAEIWYSGFKNI